MWKLKLKAAGDFAARSVFGPVWKTLSVVKKTLHNNNSCSAFSKNLFHENLEKRSCYEKNPAQCY